MSKGLYIHIPFCKYICSYCDFGKKYIHNQPVKQYIECLVHEIDMYMPFSDVDTIYIGGGTPSAIEFELLEVLLDKVCEVVDVAKLKEFSFECNPDDVNKELCQLLKNYGINRISIGAQTLNNDILDLMHRLHTKHDVENAFEIASEYFDNVSVDFMFNLPTQTDQDISEVFDFIQAYNVKHISFYSLIFEEHTRLANESYEYLDENEEADLYKKIQQKMASLGFQNYEISNFSKPGYESLHNIHYWKNDEYYGVGLSASGYINKMRYTNTYSLKSYCQIINTGNKPIAEREKITDSEYLYEQIMLGMRHYDFVNVNSTVINYIKSSQFLADKFDFTNDGVRLKREYYFISNQVILDILEGVFND